MDFTTIIGLFNLMVGLMLTTAFLFMGGGFILWYVRLGTYPTYRDDAIKMMEWAVAVLFVLVVLLGVAQYVQTHTAQATLIVGLVVAAAVIYFVATTLMAGGGEEEEHH